MSEVLQWELRFLLASFCLGMGLRAGYDVFRILRLLLPHTNRWISVEDVMFCFMGTLAVYRMFFHWNHGVWRGFSLIAVGVGMWFWSKTGSACIFWVINKRRKTSKKHKKT